MKRFFTVLAAVALAGAIYVATAPGSQTKASPTTKQFKALVAKVAKLQKDEAAVKELATTSALLLTDCMAHAVPIDQYGDNSATSTQGYSYTNPAYNNGQPFFTTALDVAPTTDTGALWITGGNSACGTDLPNAVRNLSHIAGIRVPGAALHSFSAHRP